MSTSHLRLVQKCTVLAAAAAALAAPTTAPAAEAFYGTTPQNTLVEFTSQAPGAIHRTTRLQGLATGERIVGMDQRPATGQLYMLSSAGRLLVVNPVSGATKSIGEPMTLVGTAFGFDFNPQVDRIRIVSNSEQNLRVHPDTGAVAAVDGNLAFQVGDANAGSDPNVYAVAYTNSVFGAAAPTTTELTGIDTTRDVLVRQDPPNNGTLVTRGALGVNALGQVQYDIAADQVGYAAFRMVGSPTLRLWKINRDTGQATAAAPFPVIGVPVLTAMAAVGIVRDDIARPRVVIGDITRNRAVIRRSGMRLDLSCNEGCTTTVVLRSGTRVVGVARASLPTATARRLRVTLNAFGRSLFARAGARQLTMTATTRDLAGNTSSTRVVFTTDR
ncbi:MAG: hypothetical protein JWM25_2021 [Thermoleophilia bacterium]|nr:hypothetical protein [Thermoleophilia bacterium]MCZ4497436.1 hypothetical protein [Thermoleophilia bacterium]